MHTYITFWNIVHLITAFDRILLIHSRKSGMEREHICECKEGNAVFITCMIRAENLKLLLTLRIKITVFNGPPILGQK